jgi:hypothetical protein
MKRFAMSALAMSVFATAVPVAAQQGINDPNATRIGCYRQVQIPAKYSVKKILIKESYRQYIKRANGRIDLMEYPPVYREEKKMVAPPETVMREVTCTD